MENYEFLEVLPNGNGKKIRKIKKKSSGKIYCSKEINYGRMSEKEKQQLVTEVNVLRELKHPNIVRYYDRIINKKKQLIYIIMEYCPKGDLRKEIFMRQRKKEFYKEKTVWDLFMQVVLALHEVHNFKKGSIIHRGVRPENILIDASQNLKLADFGLAKVLSSEAKFTMTNLGATSYTAPEQL